jgi:hypothetical protein
MRQLITGGDELIPMACVRMMKEWGITDNYRRARFYTIAAAGRRRRLGEEEAYWTRPDRGRGVGPETRLS